MSDDLEKLRGMSEPFPFSFSVRKQDKTQTLICHAVILTSYEVRDGEAKIQLMAEDSDPRIPHLMKFIWSNFLNEKRRELEKMLEKSKHAESRAAAELLGKQFAEGKKGE